MSLYSTKVNIFLVPLLEIQLQHLTLFPHFSFCFMSLDFLQWKYDNLMLNSHLELSLHTLQLYMCLFQAWYPVLNFLFDIIAINVYDCIIQYLQLNLNEFLFSTRKKVIDSAIFWNVLKMVVSFTQFCLNFPIIVKVLHRLFCSLIYTVIVQVSCFIHRVLTLISNTWAASWAFE